MRNYISIRHFGPYEDINLTWMRLTQFAFRHSIPGPNVSAFGLCYDDPTNTPPRHIRYDACLTIDSATVRDLMSRMNDLADASLAGIRLQSMPGAKTVMTVHRGPYYTLREAYRSVLTHRASDGVDFIPLTLPTVEVYRNNPLLIRPAALVTEIHFLKTPTSL